MTKRELVWAAVLLLVAGGLLALLLAPRATYIQAGGGVPNLTLPVLGGPGQQSVYGFRGLPLLLIFLDTRSDPDGAQVLQLERLSEALRPRAVRLVVVATDPDPAQADRFLQKMHVRFLVLSDPSGVKAREVYHIQSFPEGYLLEQTGRVKTVFPGTTRWITPDVVTPILEALAKGVPRRVQ